MFYRRLRIGIDFKGFLILLIISFKKLNISLQFLVASTKSVLTTLRKNVYKYVQFNMLQLLVLVLCFGFIVILYVFYIVK